MLITFRAFPKTDIWQKVAAVVPLVPTLETVVTVDSPGLLVETLRTTQPKPALLSKRVVNFAEHLRALRADRFLTGRTIGPH